MQQVLDISRIQAPQGLKDVLKHSASEHRLMVFLALFDGGLLSGATTSLLPSVFGQIILMCFNFCYIVGDFWISEGFGLDKLPIFYLLILL